MGDFLLYTVGVPLTFLFLVLGIALAARRILGLHVGLVRTTRPVTDAGHSAAPRAPEGEGKWPGNWILSLTTTPWAMLSVTVAAFFSSMGRSSL